MMNPRRIIMMVLVVVLGLSGCVTKENYNAQVLRTNNFQRLLSEEEKRSVELSTEVARLKDQMSSLESKSKALTAQLNDAKAQVVRSLEEVGRLQDEVKQARGGFSSVPALRGPSQEPPDRLGELQAAPVEIPEKKVEKKKGKATAQAKVQKQGQPPQSKVEPPAPVPPAPLEPQLRTPSQEPPDRLGELQETPAARPAAKPDKKVEPRKGKATVKIKVQKQDEAPSPSPQPQVESPAPTPPPPAKAEAKAKVQAKTEQEAAPDDSFFRYHKVKKGETLADIAKQYRTDAQTLRELNDMASGDAVKPGDRLIVGQKPF